MQKRSERIRKIATIAQAEERQHWQTLNSSQRNLDKELRRLAELESYRHSHLSRPQPTISVKVTHWHDYQQFLLRLDQALLAQQQVVAEGRHNCDAHRRRWLAKRQRLESLERIVQRFKSEEDELAERRGQQLLDDLRGRGEFYDPE